MICLLPFRPTRPGPRLPRDEPVAEGLGFALQGRQPLAALGGAPALDLQLSQGEARFELRTEQAGLLRLPDHLFESRFRRTGAAEPRGADLHQQARAQVLVSAE